MQSIQAKIMPAILCDKFKIVTNSRKNSIKDKCALRICCIENKKLFTSTGKKYAS